MLTKIFMQFISRLKVASVLALFNKFFCKESRYLVSKYKIWFLFLNEFCHKIILKKIKIIQILNLFKNWVIKIKTIMIFNFIYMKK